MKLHVEVVFALPQEQHRVLLELAPHSTVGDAILASGLVARRPEIKLARVGIWSRPATRETLLRDGDRVEIYRPLIADPKEARRKRAAKTRK